MIKKFEGKIDSNYRGNIVYNFYLPKTNSLRIRLKYSEINSSLSNTIYENALSEYQKHFDEKANLNYIQKQMKTEIQLAALADDTFIGNIHNRTNEKEIIVGNNVICKGCIICNELEGMLKIIINSFFTLYDVEYILEVFINE